MDGKTLGANLILMSAANWYNFRKSREIIEQTRLLRQERFELFILVCKSLELLLHTSYC